MCAVADGAIRAIPPYKETIMNWEKCPSVISGGKPYFWTCVQSQFERDTRWWVVWDRAVSQWILYNNQNRERAWFDSASSARAAIKV